MTQPSIPLRRQDRIRQALNEVHCARMTQRDATRYFNIPRSTLQCAAQNPNKPIKNSPGRPCALTAAEEATILDVTAEFANKGIPMDSRHVIEAVGIIVSHMPQERRAVLPFRDVKPGRKWVRNFIKRHKKVMLFSKPTKQEAARFAACSGEVLTRHFANVEKLIAENNIDASRMCNLDEFGVTPGKDVSGRSRSRKMMPRECSRDIKIPNFSYVKRVTLMPTISATGETGPCLFVFKGKLMPFRNVLRNGNIVSESPLCMLPRGSVCALREENKGVGQINFRNWAVRFVSSLKDLTANGRKVFLIYDAYRSHLSLDVLQMFDRNNIIVYALPAHTSGKTQPLDVVVFSIFKKELNKLMDSVATRAMDDRWDVFKLCQILRGAYETSHTLEHIKAAFCRAGLWPLDSTKLLSVPRPAAPHQLDVILKKNELLDLLEQKRTLLRDQVLGEEAVLHSSGYVDTTCGEVMTSTNALSLIEAHVNRQKATKKTAKALAKQKHLQEQRRKTAREKRKSVLLEYVDIRRANLCGETVDVYRKHVRSIAERRAFAKLNLARRSQRDSVLG